MSDAATADQSEARCKSCGATVRFPHAELARVICQSCGTRYVVGLARHLGIPYSPETHWVLCRDISGSVEDRR